MVTVEYHKKTDGIIRIERPSGLSRYLTFWERARYFFGARP